MGSALVTIAPGGKGLQEGLRILNTYISDLAYCSLLVQSQSRSRSTAWSGLGFVLQMC